MKFCLHRSMFPGCFCHQYIFGWKSSLNLNVAFHLVFWEVTICCAFIICSAFTDDCSGNLGVLRAYNYISVRSGYIRAVLQRCRQGSN